MVSQSNEALREASWKRIRVPIVGRLPLHLMYEHPPLNYYKYGEYPRFIRPPHDNAPPWEWRWVRAQR